MTTKQNIDIKNFLPHRLSMLMVDELVFIDNENVSTKFFIKSNCVFVHNEKMQEAGLIENAAQTCSAIVGQNFFDKDDTEGKSNKLVGFISAIKNVSIHDLPSVNDEIITESNLVAKFDTDSYTICTMNCETKVNNEKIADFVMNLIIQEASDK